MKPLSFRAKKRITTATVVVLMLAVLTVVFTTYLRYKRERYISDHGLTETIPEK